MIPTLKRNSATAATAPMTTDGHDKEPPVPSGRNEIADDARRDHDHRKRDVQREDQDERERRDRTERNGVNDAVADPVGGEADDRNDRGFDAGKHRRDPPDVAVYDVDPRQRDQQDERRQHEQSAGQQSARRPMQQPADVGRELLCLGPR
jgi:hypothetical protein